MNTIKQRLTGRMIRISSVFILALMFIQCEGPMGPMGPRGYDGIDGEAFAYSVIYDVETTDWSGDIDGYAVSLSVPEITTDIYYYGAVLVYRLIEVAPISFNMLPYTYVDDDLIVYMDFDAYIGGIDLYYKEVYQGVNDTPAPGVLMSFKVMIIEGIPLATLKNMVDIKDYDAVATLLDNTMIMQEEIRVH